jgi:hypothetical protein
MRRQILLVHKEQATRDGLVEALNNEGFIGIPVASSQQALDYLQGGGNVSVILLDEQAGWIRLSSHPAARSGARLDPGDRDHAAAGILGAVCDP